MPHEQLSGRDDMQCCPVFVLGGDVMPWEPSEEPPKATAYQSIHNCIL